MEPTPRNVWLRLLRAAAASALFAALVAGTSLIVLFEVARHGNVVENGPVELAQIGLLALASLAYALRARAANASGGPARAYALCGLLVLAMAVRELDGFFDLAFFHGAWLAVDAGVFAGFLVLLLHRPAASFRDLADFAGGPECPLFVVSIALAVLFAQALGYKGLWKHVFDVPIWADTVAPFLDEKGHLPGDIDILRHVKNTVEESFELACYLGILASAILPPALARRRRESA